jgi:hypothetical protein
MRRGERQEGCCGVRTARSRVPGNFAKATLRYGSQSLEVTMHHAAEEGLASHEEGYPDLIEEDARVRPASIWC